MVVQEREYFRGKVVPLEEWKIKLQQDFPFMEQDPNDDGHNIYRKWGFECYGGWYRLLRECCEAIVKRYEKDGIGIDDIDFVPAQIKEKFGTNLVFLFIKTLRNFIYDTKNHQDQGRKVVLIFCSE